MPAPTVLVLGPVQLSAGPVRTRSARQVLGWVALHAGRATPLARCGRTLWPDLAGAAATRKARDAARALARDFPAVIAVDGEQIGFADADTVTDEQLFRSLLPVGGVADARQPGRAAPQRLSSALALWRAMPYPDLAHVAAVRRRIEDLLELRYAATEQRLLAILDDDTFPDYAVIAELRAAVHDFPDRERLRRILVIALFRASRQVEALHEVESLRRGAGPGGARPGSRTDALHRALLRGDLAAMTSAL